MPRKKRRLPVELYELLDIKDIQLLEVPLAPGYHGIAVKTPEGRNLILINENDSYERNVQSVRHEILHFEGKSHDYIENYLRQNKKGRKQ